MCTELPKAPTAGAQGEPESFLAVTCPQDSGDAALCPDHTRSPDLPWHLHPSPSSAPLPTWWLQPEAWGQLGLLRALSTRHPHLRPGHLPVTDITFLWFKPSNAHGTPILLALTLEAPLSWHPLNLVSDPCPGPLASEALCLVCPAPIGPSSPTPPGVSLPEVGPSAWPPISCTHWVGPWSMWGECFLAGCTPSPGFRPPSPPVGLPCLSECQPGTSSWRPQGLGIPVGRSSPGPMHVAERAPRGPGPLPGARRGQRLVDFVSPSPERGEQR